MLTATLLNALCGIALCYFSLSLLWNTLHAVLDHPVALTRRLGIDAN